MKITVNKSQLSTNYPRWLLQAGYAYERNRQGQDSFARSVAGAAYPRFHIYVDEAEQTLVFNLHLDQKKASYAGQTAHSGEYDNSLVEQEAVRLKSLLQ